MSSLVGAFISGNKMEESCKYAGYGGCIDIVLLVTSIVLWILGVTGTIPGWAAVTFGIAFSAPIALDVLLAPFTLAWIFIKGLDF